MAFDPATAWGNAITAVGNAIDTIATALGPKQDVFHIYDIRKESGNKSLWLLIGGMAFFVLLLIGIIALSRNSKE